MRNFLIDTDTASDDAVAIMMALADPNVRVLALTTVAGNVGLEQATQQRASDRRDLRARDVPVFAGADKPLTRAHDHAHWFHGNDGLGDRGFPAPKRKAEREHAVDAILRLAETEPGLTLVTLGPLTNIALALARDPRLAERIGRCVVMGGAPCCEGNVTPAAEYNIWVDPEAARARLPLEAQHRDGRLACLARRHPCLTRRKSRQSWRSARPKPSSRSTATRPPARPISRRPAKSAFRSPIRPPWRWRSTARSALAGGGIASRSNARASSRAA